MAVQQRLEARLLQKLVLTPALQQAIKLLPMSTLELVDLLTQEVVDNPMLEEIPVEDVQSSEATAQTDRAEAQTKETEPTDSWEDADFEYFFGDYLDDGYRVRSSHEARELPPIENAPSPQASLADHLIWQLSLRSGDRDKLEREIGLAIIGNLNEDGYLVTSVDEIAEMAGWPSGTVRKVLEVVQSFDPIGVAARGLQECLLLQIRSRGLSNTISETIVRDHLGLLENREGLEIAHRLGLSIDKLRGHVDLIRQLDPKPGSRYNHAASQYVIPDVYVVKEADRYVATLNDDGMPQLRISPLYRKLLNTQKGHNDETRAYAKEKFRSALWLLKSVDQRQKTIYKVATSIIAFQTDFLDHGIEFLKPLVLSDVADDIGMHESTVSRVVNHKYMHTPRGVFEMKYFFHSGISSAYGESVSSLTVKQRIRKIVEEENPRKPLSDARIVGLLEDSGLVLARRTIAKYREELKIPGSSQRKVLF